MASLTVGGTVGGTIVVPTHIKDVHSSVSYQGSIYQNSIVGGCESPSGPSGEYCGPHTATSVFLIYQYIYLRAYSYL